MQALASSDPKKRHLCCLLDLFPEPSHGRKIRPVLVMPDTGDEDVTVAPITTSLTTVPGSVPLKQFREAGLLKPLAVRVQIITTLYKERALTRLGRLSSGDFAQIAAKWQELFARWEQG